MEKGSSTVGTQRQRVVLNDDLHATENVKPEELSNRIEDRFHIGKEVVVVLLHVVLVIN